MRVFRGLGVLGVQDVGVSNLFKSLEVLGSRARKVMVFNRPPPDDK